MGSYVPNTSRRVLGIYYFFWGSLCSADVTPVPVGLVPVGPVPVGPGWTRLDAGHLQFQIGPMVESMSQMIEHIEEFILI